MLVRERSFLCEERVGDQNNNNRQFFVFLFCLETFLISPPTKNFHIIRKRKRWRILRWTTRSIPRTKTAQCQFQRYASLFVLNVEHHHQKVGGWYVFVVVCLTTKLMRYEILENFFLSPQIQQQKDFEHHARTSFPIIETLCCTLLRS